MKKQKRTTKSRKSAGATLAHQRWRAPGAKPRERTRMKQVWAERKAKWAIADKLWEAVNDRRCALIERKHTSGVTLTPEETAELERLQMLAEEYLRVAAPLPLEELRQGLAEIERGKNDRRN